MLEMFRDWCKAAQKLCVLAIGGQRRGYAGEWAGGRRAPQRMRRHALADDRARLNDGALADSHVRQDQAVRTDEDVVFDNHFAVIGRALGARIEVSEDRRSNPDGAVVADRQTVW